MLVVYFLVSLICILYFIIILSFSIGWDKIKPHQKGLNSPSGVFISVVIALRNEEKNISTLINSLSNQTLNKKLFELILVDDNSSDNTWQLIKDCIPINSNFRCFKLTGKHGKKNSIELGIKNSNGNLIVTTDGDCTHNKEWLDTIFHFYNINKPKLIIGPVLMTGNTCFENIQKIDFLSLIASGAGSSGINRPIMCNGANLAFEKEAFNQITDPMIYKELSGDDVFLMHKIKKAFPGQVKFLKSNHALVYTNTEKKIKRFILQRVRWASKSKSYFDKDTIATAFVVLFINLSLFLTLILSFIDIRFCYLFICQLISKSIVDFILLNKVSSFFKEKSLLKYFIPAELLNIVIIPVVALTGFIYKVKWK